MNEHTRKEVVMQDGFKVPIVCIEALEDLQEIWPGATTVQARPGIVRAVLQAKEKDDLRKRNELNSPSLRAVLQAKEKDDLRKWNELNSPSTPSKKLPEALAWTNHSFKRL